MDRPSATIAVLDLLCRQFPQQSRQELYAAILCGEVSSPQGRLRDPKQPVAIDLTLSIERERFVSRAGAKLEAALTSWRVPVIGLTWVDAGASTGGFTDCLLQHGARLVHAVDVGYNQLHYRLRTSAQVQVHERTNILDITHLDPQPDAAVCDLSFRSLRGVLAHILALTSGGWAIALLKPQFELAAENRWGRGQGTVPEGGVVTDQATLAALVARVGAELGEQGVTVQRVLPSPIRGRAGNQEYLVEVCARRP